MGVVQGMVGLFFSLLFAHITIRNRIASPHITYMETFYFAVYIIIIMLIVDVVMFSKNRKLKIIQYKDSLIIVKVGLLAGLARRFTYYNTY